MAHRKKAAGLWRRRFLAAMARTANARLSADMAGVDHSSAYQLRERDSVFAAAWVRARDWGRARAKAEGRPVHACGRPRARPRGGGPDPRPLKPLAVKEGGTKLVRIGEGRWGPAEDEIFFAAFERTGSLRQAARAAGFSTNAVHNRRRTDIGFAERWQAVKEQGREGNEMVMIHAVGRAFDPDPEAERAAAAAADALPRPTVAEAIQIARLFQRGERDTGRRGKGPPERTFGEAIESILGKIEAIEAHEEPRKLA